MKELTPAQLLSLEFIGQAITATDRNFGLSDVVRDGENALRASVERLNPLMLDYFEKTNKNLEQLRLDRMAIQNEVHAITQSIKDAAAFLGSEQASKGIDAMRQYVEVCERIQALRADGTFETIINAFCSIMESETK